ncbi:MAG: hypothetical protein ABIJ57_15740 [Pseudomonadota bacterium]
MKRFLSIAVVFLVLVFVGAALAEFPAPFENAKRVAMINPAENGIHWWSAKDPDNQQILFSIGFWPEKETVMLSLFDESDYSIKALSLVKDKFIAEQYFVRPTGLFPVAQEEVDKETALAAAFDFFRTLVSKGLLPSLI